jgi:putative transposase
MTMPELTMSDALVRDNVAQELERLEAEAHDVMQDKGRSFLGPERVLAVSPFDRATSWESIRGRNPTFAVGRGQREAFFEAVTILHEFRKAYRAAFDSWRIGLREVLFPAGTSFMRCGHGALVPPS